MVSRLDRETDLFRQRSLSAIERDKLFGAENESSGDMDDVERTAAHCCRVTCRKLIGLLLDGGRRVRRALPPTRGNVLREGGDGLVHFRYGDFSAEGFQANSVFNLQFLPLC